MVPPQHCSVFPQEFDMEHNMIPVATSTKDTKDTTDLGLPHHHRHHHHKVPYQDQKLVLPLQPDPLDPPHPPSGPDIVLLPFASDDPNSSTENSNLARSHPVLPTDLPRQHTTDEASHSEHQLTPIKSTNGAIGTVLGTANRTEEEPIQQLSQHPPRDQIQTVTSAPMPRIAKRPSPDSEEQARPEAGKYDFPKGALHPATKKGTSTSTPTPTPTPTPTLMSTPSQIKESPHTEIPQKENMEPIAPSPSKSKDAPVPKKRARADTKKGASDTASLFQKIFADREPGKRKIRTKSVHEIPIDLGADEDDSDFEDTKQDSNEEDEDMNMPDDASEDEKPGQDSFSDEQELMTALWQWASKDNDPEVCCVCLGRSTEADNVFVYCDTLDCALCVHQACYGVKKVPSESEPWLCDRCKAPPEEVVSCVCCPSKDGAFRRLIPEDPSGGWVHVVCALWLPETTLGEPENVDRISVRDIPERNWNLTCYLCSDPQDAALGACVQCDAGQCRKSFHITCAQNYSLLETLEDSDMADPYFMYCKQHGATDGHPKINGWAKWVRARDGFLKKWQEDEGLKRTQRLIELQGNGDSDGGEGLVEFFEHSYSRFKQAREKRIARERSELSRQYSIGYYLGNKIDKSRSRLEVISTKAQLALQEQRRIEMHTRNLLSSLLECANYLENVSAEQLEAPLSIDTTLAWYNSLPDTSRWKCDIQGIIQTIDIDSLACDNPYTQPGYQGQLDTMDDSEGGKQRGRSSKGIYGKLSKKGKASTGKNVKAKKVLPKPTKSQAIVLTSSRGRLIKRDNYSDEDYSSNSPYSSHSSLPPMSTVKIPKPIVPCTVCHQLTLPDEKLDLERDEEGMISPMAIKVLNRMVACATCQRQFHPKCLDPPMARVPPRGYSWNCEDCDSSGESHGSSGESSPTIITHPRQSHSADLDEALMVLADTAMTVSAYEPPHPSRPSGKPQGVKRALASGQELTMGSKVKEPKAKKVKTEGDLPPKSTKPKVKGDKEPKKKTKTKGDTEIAPSSKTVAIQPSPVAPIVRGNLRIYPPGPHIAPVPSQESKQDKETKPKKTKAKEEASTEKPKAKVAKAKAPKEDPTSPVPKKKVKIEAPKTKKVATEDKAKAKPKNKASTPEPPKTKAKPPKVSPPKEKVTVRRGSLPAVPEPPPPKPKEIIRYTVGEKTVEELTARDDVEVERRENVKFRRLRGRTLTMPAPPQEWNDEVTGSESGTAGPGATTVASTPAS
ncbi:hypothetical protein BG000_009994 [Podila horticola]|nr:hypothetical protein BG000_009994 [Podila horticola]